jgi:hypothetical protein
MADNKAAVIKNLEHLEAAKIPISLALGRRLVKPLMEGRSVKWAISQCKLGPTKSIGANMGLVTAFARYAEGKSLKWFRSFPRDFYPIGPGVLMPVNPYGFWAEDGRLHVLWVQSWKGSTLDPLQKAIFNTILSQRIFVGDFKNANLQWVDLREQKKGRGRGVEILRREDLGEVTDDELRKYIEILYVAFLEYSEARKARRIAEKATVKPSTMPLFPEESGDRVP